MNMTLEIKYKSLPLEHYVLVIMRQVYSNICNCGLLGAFTLKHFTTLS
jgi:hypothetical protein